jgi:hypothetical protein
MGSPSSLPGSKVAVKLVTSEADLPVCARLADIALKPDPFHEFKARYCSKNVYEETLEKITEALRDDRGRYCLLKAVVPASSTSESEQSTAQTTQGSGADAAEIIVGFAQWRCGYVEVPKMDPFAPRKEPERSPSVDAGVTNVAVAEVNGQDTGSAVSADMDLIAAGKVESSRKTHPFYSNPHDELARKLMNVYIGTMRGKRHVCKSQMCPAVSLSSCPFFRLQVTDHSIRILRSPPLVRRPVLPTSRHRAETAQLGN